MQKVYLLLRNNQQTGPHDIEELVQLGLQPKDLIWVEGKSAGWSYPSEVDSLKHLVADTTLQDNETAHVSHYHQEPVKDPEPKLSPKNIFVSLPSGKTVSSQAPEHHPDPIEQKAEELRQRVKAMENTAVPYVPLNTAYKRSLEEAEEEYTSWLLQQKTKRKAVPQKKLAVFATAIVVAIIGGGWAVKTLFFNQPLVVPPSAVIEQKVATEKSPENNEVQNETDLNNNTISQVAWVQSKTIADTKSGSSKPVEKKNVDAIPPPVEQKVEEKVVSTEEPIPGTTTSAESEKPGTITETPKEKKKTLKETINDLFKKKKEEPADDPEVIPNRSTGGRTARKRDDGVAAPEERSTINLEEQVQIRSNQTDDNWMLGVKGLKLTVINRSNSTVEKASVEVVYFNEQNAVLDKKVLNCSNIGPKKSVLLSVPDNRLADHAEYKLISATGTQDGYARQ